MRGLYPILPLRDLVLLPGMITRIQLVRPSEVAAIEFHLSSGRRGEPLSRETVRDAGGRIVAQGRLETIARVKRGSRSHTAKILAKFLKQRCATVVT